MSKHPALKLAMHLGSVLNLTPSACAHTYAYVCRHIHSLTSGYDKELRVFNRVLNFIAAFLC